MFKVSTGHVKPTDWSFGNGVNHDDLQQQAITSNHPAVMLIAGPGSGKTNVLASRLAYLLMTGQCSPNEILLLSFTNSAANELKVKGSKLLSNTVATVDGVICNTFHGFCKSVITKYWSLTSFSANKKVLIVDSHDQMVIMQDLLKSKRLPSSPIDCNKILTQIRYWKELGWSHLSLRRKDMRTMTEQRAYDIYASYQNKLKLLSALDFGDLLLLTLKLFRNYPHIVRNYQQVLKHILVDEFQDISPAQYEILRLLAVPIVESDINNIDIFDDFSSTDNRELYPYQPNLHRIDSHAVHNDKSYRHRVNIFCAGDDDQSIYSWRGAQLELMKRFRFDFPNSCVLRLDKSYRLPESLYKVANTLVSSLEGRIPKSLDTQPFRRIDGSIDSAPTIDIKRFNHERDELEFIVQYLQSTMSKYNSIKALNNHYTSTGMAQKNPQQRTIAILARTQQEVKLIINELLRTKIHFRCRTYGSWNVPVLSSNIHRSSLNLLRLISNPDDDVAFQAALDNDIVTSFITSQDIQQVILPIIRTVIDQRSSGQSSVSYLDILRECVLTGKLEGKYNIALTRFLQKFDAWRNDLVRYYRRGKSAEKIMYDILFSAYHVRWNEDIKRTVSYLSHTAATFDSLSEFFITTRFEGDYITDSQYGDNVDHSKDSVSTSQSSDSDGLTIWVMAMQAAKGLEFDEVILPYWVDGIVPKHTNIEEERRLAFVSMTRAKERVHISFSKHRTHPVHYENSEVLALRPSPFVMEILRVNDASTSYRDLSSNNGRLSPESTTGRQLSKDQSLSNSINTETKKTTPFHPHLTNYLINLRSNQLNRTIQSVENERIDNQFDKVSSNDKYMTTVLSDYSKTKQVFNSSSEKSFNQTRPRGATKKTIRIDKSVNKSQSENFSFESIDRITTEVIKSYMTSKIIPKTQLKEYFREVLASKGLKRGSIPVTQNDKRTKNRPISQCTSDQLGAYIVDMIENGLN